MVILGSFVVTPVLYVTESHALETHTAHAGDRALEQHEAVDGAIDATTHVAGDRINYEAIVREYFRDTPVLVHIARCESNFRHVEVNGEVLRGRANRSDIGVMQVNEYYHGTTAQKLGIDIHDIEGNLAYAKYLYTEQGTRPWNASKHCWSRY